MRLAIFLHFYQPYNQQPDILDRVVNECYRPVLSILRESKGQVTINVSGVLLELLHNNHYDDVVTAFKDLVATAKVELTGSAAYHAILPMLPASEAARQIMINNELLAKYLDFVSPSGFFSPEMALDSTLCSTLAASNCSWVGAPQMAHPSGNPAHNVLYKYENSSMYVMFRDKRVSSLMLSGVVRSAEELRHEISDIYAPLNYSFAVMDAETFGHHRIGHEAFLHDVLNSALFECANVSSILKEGASYIENSITIRPSTWTNEEQDFWLDSNHTKSTTKNSFILWNDPENPIHTLQWLLTNLAIAVVSHVGLLTSRSAVWLKSRTQLDAALASDQYWWASAKPWWSLEMIEQGAFALKEAITTAVSCMKEGETVLLDSVALQQPASQTLGRLQILAQADTLYRQILDKAFEWQRTGYIRRKHLENSSTYMKKPLKNRTNTEWYNQLVLEFVDQMESASRNRHFELAIKWRDALLKLQLETDVYDILHVVDELWSSRNIPELKPFLEHTWEEFSPFVRGFLLNEQGNSALTKPEFLAWKKKRTINNKLKS